MKNCLANIFQRSTGTKPDAVAKEKELPASGKASMTSSTVTNINTGNTRRVTISPAQHAGRKWYGSKGVSSAEEIFVGAAPEKHGESAKILQGTFNGFDFNSTTICASTNGLVRSAIYAYASHHHLTLRPEDVWFAILTQVGFYINAHSEELREHFVSHKGRKKLVVTRDGTIDTVDLGEMSVAMADLIQANIKDPDFQKWIMPNFSTTKEEDVVVAAVLMMGAMQKYFEYFYAICCGIPSVTLLGAREDWAEMLRRLKKLTELGDEPTRFYTILKPVLSFFVRSFDAPTDPQVIDFWDKIAREDGGSGNTYLSGWITAFCFWNAEGKRMYADPAPLKDVSNIQINDDPSYSLDVALQGWIDTDVVPAGFAVVPATVNDNGEEYKTKLIAGSVGIQVTSSGDKLDEGPIYSVNKGTKREPTGESDVDSLQPVTGWWMYKLKPELQTKE